jgi:hypothetical protein
MCERVRVHRYSGPERGVCQMVSNGQSSRLLKWSICVNYLPCSTTELKTNLCQTVSNGVCVCLFVCVYVWCPSCAPGISYLPYLMEN